MTRSSEGPVDTPAAPPPAAAPRGGVLEVAGVFARLGCISFGGPVAHLGYFRAEVVERRRWLDDAHYADLVALCQFLPGPASSQVVFALGKHRAGLAGALVASLCFTLPSAALMIAFAYGVASLGDVSGAGWLHGLKLAAVAVVAQAVWGMGKKLCPDRARTSIAIAAAAVLLTASGAVAQLGVIVAGGVVGWWRYRGELAAPGAATPPVPVRGRVGAAAALAVCFALLLVLPVVATASDARLLAEVDAFYRSGSLVFGGGHVVLPLLRAEVVPSGWLTDAQFLAGYGAAQAVPGPLFTFAAYLGAAMDPAATGVPAWANGVWCLVAIFVPAWLLIGGALPFWHGLRGKAWAQAALAGANAAVVGVLLAALYDPVITAGVRDHADVAAALVAFGVLEQWKAPPWLVVGVMAAVGQWVLV
jgi:chromate transporter